MRYMLLIYATENANAQSAEEKQRPEPAPENDPHQDEGDHHPGDAAFVAMLRLWRFRPGGRSFAAPRAM